MATDYSEAIRLLLAGQAAAARAIETEAAHDLGNVAQALEMNVGQAATLARDALVSLPSDPARATKLLELSREVHQDAAAGVEQLQGIVSRMRDAAPARPPAACRVDRVVAAMVAILREPLERVARLTVEVDGSARVPMEAADLGQIVVSLLLNAADAVAGRQDASIVIRVVQTPERVRVTVTDTGAGISVEDHETLFEPRFTTKPGGGGLGLSIAAELVTEAGGEIRVSSDRDETSFTIDLPLAR